MHLAGKGISKKRIVALGILLLVSGIRLNAFDVLKYNPDSPAFFIGQMEWMLRRSPHFFPINVTTFYNGFNVPGYDSDNSSSLGAFTGEWFNLFAGTIIPIPSVEWLAISGSLTGAIDSFNPGNGDPETYSFVTSENANFNIYANLGVTLVFPVVNVGIFGGYYADLMSQAEATLSNLDGSGFEPKREFRLSMVPIVKAPGVLSVFLDIISNYINFGSFLRPRDFDFGQRFVSPAFQIADNPLVVEAYYSNERFNSLARNWIFGAEAKYGGNLYALLDLGYRHFYDVKPLSNMDRSTFFARPTIGYETAEGNGILLSGLYDFLGPGVGIGAHYRGLEVYAEWVFKGFRAQVDGFTLSLRLYTKRLTEKEE